MTAYLETRLEDDSLTSGTGPLVLVPIRGRGEGTTGAGSATEPSAARRSRTTVLSTCQISTNARKLLAAIACTGSAARCAEWGELTATPGILGIDFRSEDGE